MSTSEMLHIRMDGDLKARGNEALSAMGLTAADAVRIFYHRIVAEQGFPLELKVPNARTQAAMIESAEIISSRKARFETSEEMIRSLEE